jgi:glycosyltransferase involved in cell wall biosynthesis
MKPASIRPDNTTVVMLSFEGPDAYSLVGGLGVRSINLSRALARHGFRTHFFFVGDPRLRGEDAVCGGRVVLHRWCQWISKNHPGGVYQGEHDKHYDFSRSIPEFVTERIVRPVANDGGMVVVLAEEWHTAEAVSRLSDCLKKRGMRDRVVMLWNANNTYGFDLVDWSRLNDSAAITTVSRYMKHIMWGMGLNPLVIPNGIPASLLRSVDDEVVDGLRRAFGAGLILFKMARWHPDKRWNVAVEAVAELKRAGLRPLLIARGGLEPYGQEVMDGARSMGLTVREANTTSPSLEDSIAAIREATPADVINVRFHVPPKLSRLLYRASDGVLANSGHEPFGLVGLEAMAAGGVAYTGCTGEDYAIPFVNCFVLETDDPAEISSYAAALKDSPDEETRMRRLARRTARQFTWDATIQNLLGKLDNQARAQGMLNGTNGSRPAHTRAEPNADLGGYRFLPLVKEVEDSQLAFCTGGNNGF